MQHRYYDTHSKTIIQSWDNALVYCLPTQDISQACNPNLQVVSHSVNAPVTQLDVIALELNYHHQAILGNTRFKIKIHLTSAIKDRHLRRF